MPSGQSMPNSCCASPATASRRRDRRPTDAIGGRWSPTISSEINLAVLRSESDRRLYPPPELRVSIPLPAHIRPTDQRSSTRFCAWQLSHILSQELTVSYRLKTGRPLDRICECRKLAATRRSAFTCVDRHRRHVTKAWLGHRCRISRLVSDPCLTLNWRIADGNGELRRGRAHDDRCPANQTDLERDCR